MSRGSRISARRSSHRSELDPEEVYSTEALLAATEGILDNSDPFARDLAPPDMINLVGDPRGGQEPSAVELDALLDMIGETKEDGSFVPHGGDLTVMQRVEKPPLPIPQAATIPNELQDAVQLINDVRSAPNRAADTLNSKRRPRHIDGNNLKFQYEGSLAHMRTKEGVKACDEAINTLRSAASVSSVQVCFLNSFLFRP